MYKEEKMLQLSEILRPGPIVWPKKGTLHALLKKLTGSDSESERLEIVYEDEHVIAFHEVDEDDDHAHKWSVRVTIAPKQHVATLLDLGVGHEAVTAALLAGVQQAALRLGLHAQGFEVFAGVLPPFQETSCNVGNRRQRRLGLRRVERPHARVECHPGDRAPEGLGIRIGSSSYTEGPDMFDTTVLTILMLARSPGGAATQCSGADPAIVSAGVKSVTPQGGVNRYHLGATVTNIGSAKQPSNTVQSVDIYQNGVKVDAHGVLPLRPNES
jgi:hypothetical protein